MSSDHSTYPHHQPANLSYAAEQQSRGEGEKKKRKVVMSAGRRESPIRMRTAGLTANEGLGGEAEGTGGGAGGVVTLAGREEGGLGWAERAGKCKHVVTPEGSVASSHSNVAKRRISGEMESSPPSLC